MYTDGMRCLLIETDPIRVIREEQVRMGRKLGCIASFASGLAVGYLLGLFSAPQAGRDTLEDLGDKAMQLKGKAEEAAEWVKEDVLGSRASVTDLVAD
jgi:hypothetical protein